MRVLLLCLSQGQGGLELMVYNLVGYFLANQIDFHVVLGDDTFLSKKIAGITDKFSLIGIPSIQSFPLITAGRICKLIYKLKPDIIHIHCQKDLPLSVLCKVFLPFKLVCTRHMDIINSKQDLVHRFVYSQIDLYLTISKIMLRDCKKIPMNPKKIRHIYNGVSSPVNYTAENRRLYFQKIDLNPSLFTIGILGRIVTGKGQRYCIEAVNILHQQQYTVQLIIAGYVMDSAYLEECKRFVQSVNLEKYVRFIDFIEQPMTMLPTLDVVVLASKCEGFGNILIEAMRCEIPVIGSNAGGVPEIITHEKSGLLFEPENSADLAEKIKFLIDYPDERKKMATYGKTMADEFFDEDKNYAMLIKLYKEIQGSGKTYSFIAVFVFTGLIVSQILIHFSYARQ